MLEKSHIYFLGILLCSFLWEFLNCRTVPYYIYNKNWIYRTSIYTNDLHYGDISPSWWYLRLGIHRWNVSNQCQRWLSGQHATVPSEHRDCNRGKSSKWEDVRDMWFCRGSSFSQHCPETEQSQMSDCWIVNSGLIPQDERRTSCSLASSGSRFDINLMDQSWAPVSCL